MSFLLSPSTSQGFCDWRISLEEDCENRGTYRGFLIAGATITFLSFLLGSYSLIFRKIVLHDTWRSFTRGPNLSLLVFSLTPLFSGTQFLLVLVDYDRLANAALWGLMTPVSFFSNLLYLSTIGKLLPSSVMLTSSTIKSQWIPTDNQRNFILLFLYSLFFLSHSIIMPLAEWEHSQGRIALSSALLKLGLTITTVAITLYSACYFFVALSLVRRMQVLLNEISGVTSDEAGFMTLIVTKLKGNIVFCLFYWIQYPVFFLPLAYYPEFFADQTCSMAYAFVITVFVPFSALPLFVTFILSDFKKVFLTTTQRGKGSTSEFSKRGDKLEMTKSLNGSKSNMDKIIEDLAPDVNNSNTNII